MKIAAYLLGLTLALGASPAWSQDTAAANAAQEVASPRIILTWVPPYARAAVRTQLDKLYSGAGPRNALTHLGLQFWKPTSTGDLVRVSSSGTITNAEIHSYVKWGKTYGVKILLTVYNGDPTWDWALAKSAFADNRTAFVNALVQEMQARHLDGIDIDLEGPAMDPTPEEKVQFLAFIRALKNKVHALGKIVNVDTFPYIYNAPNQTWWADLFPLVDMVTSMGYTDLGRNAPDAWATYTSQRAAAGNAKNMAKLLIGLPSYEDVWQGNNAVDQISWFTPASQRVGLGIWDGQNQAPSWQSAPVWSRLKAIRAQ